VTLLEQIRRAHAAKMCGGPDGRDGLTLAACLPSVEEIADRLMEGDGDLTHAEALEEAYEARTAALEALEAVLTGRAR
jgi:hypothetical protein